MIKSRRNLIFAYFSYAMIGVDFMTIKIKTTEMKKYLQCTHIFKSTKVIGITILV